MGALIITIVTSILCGFGVISYKAFMIAVMVSLAWSGIGAALYFRFGLLKFFYHDVLGWHTPDNSPQWSDGLSQHSRCKHCGRDIMQDSQGNWFC